MDLPQACPQEGLSSLATSFRVWSCFPSPQHSELRLKEMLLCFSHSFSLSLGTFLARIHLPALQLLRARKCFSFSPYSINGDILHAPSEVSEIHLRNRMVFCSSQISSGLSVPVRGPNLRHSPSAGMGEAFPCLCSVGFAQRDKEWWQSTARQLLAGGRGAAGPWNDKLG